MTIDDHRPGPGPARWSRVRIAVAVTGLAGLLGAGAYEITAQILDRESRSGRGDVGALAPEVVPVSAPAASVSPLPRSAPPAPSVGASAGRSPAAPASAPPRASTPAPAPTLTVDEQIRAAREAAAKDGHPVQRPLEPAPGVVAASVNERTEKTKTGVLRIITARSDLTGQRELLWAADRGTEVDHAHCTQKLHFSNNAQAAIRPNVLLCWRTSATRSVATVLVDRAGKPSAAKSVAVINREWLKLG